MGFDVIPRKATTMETSDPGRSRSRVSAYWLGVPVFVLLTIFFYGLRYDLRGYSLLTHFLDPHASGIIIRWETHPVQSQEITLPLGNNFVRARLYTPSGVAHPPGMVLVHGIHHLGMDEPRLMSFARAAAGGGFAVLTPEVAALADYRVDSASIATIGESPDWLQQRLGTGPVTLVGVSFAGGLSLLAACDPRYAPHIRAFASDGRLRRSRTGFAFSRHQPGGTPRWPVGALHRA